MEKNNNSEIERPKIGIGVLILNKNSEVLLGQRKNGSHGAGEWCFPGGHLEFGETVFETAKREVLEETGLIIDEFELISVSDEMRYIKTDNKHYLNIGVKGKYAGGEPQTMEPDKCDGWKWFSLKDLPKNMFEGSANTLKNFLDKKIYQPK